MQKTYKILLYNVQNCNGIGNNALEYFYKFHQYIFHSDNVLKKISNLITKLNPDIVALNEVDLGSFRSKFINQLRYIHDKGNFNDYLYSCRYSGLLQYTPFINKQGSGLLTKRKIKHKTTHHLNSGFKNLILEIKTSDNLSLILVHLSMRKNARKKQIKELYTILKNKTKNTIVMGDFNIMRGFTELNELIDKVGLKPVECPKTYPSWNPKKHLDLMFLSNNMKVKKIIAIKSNLSDHLPLFFEVSFV